MLSTSIPSFTFRGTRPGISLYYCHIKYLIAVLLLCISFSNFYKTRKCNLGPITGIILLELIRNRKTSQFNKAYSRCWFVWKPESPGFHTEKAPLCVLCTCTYCTVLLRHFSTTLNCDFEDLCSQLCLGLNCSIIHLSSQ